MTSVPKPLKFLRPHYDTLKACYEAFKPSENKVSRCYHCVRFDHNQDMSL